MREGRDRVSGASSRSPRTSVAVVVIGIAVTVTGLLALPVAASQSGRDGFSGNPATNGGALCSTCHAGGASPPTLVLSGPTNILAGSTHTYTATLSGGPGVTGGIGVSATDALGSFSPVDADLHPVGDEISHVQPKPFAAGQVTFQFAWTAPGFDGAFTLYAAGNSTNGQIDLLGDAIAANTLVVNVTGGGPPPPPDPPPPTPPVTLEPFASGFENPVALRHAGDERLFVVEQPGRIRIVAPDGTVAAQPFLDISSRVDSSQFEQGLLGLAFHPDYATNGWFYVNYTRDPPTGLDRTRISRFSVSSDPDVADAGSEVVLLEFEQPFANHNGGDIAFGPDGFLYIAAGDGGAAGDPNDAGQDREVLLGKILRIDVDAASGGPPDCDVSGSGAYGVPASNAFVGQPQACDEIFALGVRNPWRISFDRLRGDLWIADVGQGAYEEVNLLPAGIAAGLNLGWRCYEGNTAYDLTNCGLDYFFPVHTTAHSAGDCSITGGYVYRGSDFKSLRGRYFFTDFCNTAIRTLKRQAGSFVVEEVTPAGAINQPVSFGENAAGELFVSSLGGSVYRVTSTEPVPVLPGWGLAVLAAALCTPIVAGRRIAARVIRF